MSDKAATPAPTKVKKAKKNKDVSLRDLGRKMEMKRAKRRLQIEGAL